MIVVIIVMIVRMMVVVIVRMVIVMIIRPVEPMVIINFLNVSFDNLVGDGWAKRMA